MLSMLGKTVSRRHFEFFYFSKKTSFDILCKLSLKENNYLHEMSGFDISCKLGDNLHELSKPVSWEK